MTSDEKMGRWLIVVALMVPKRVRAAVFTALLGIGEL